MIVRKGTIQDIQDCVDLSKEFWYQLDFSKQIPFVNNDVRDMFTMCLASDLVAVVYDEDQLIGVVAGLSSPCIANFNFQFGAELIWYVKKGYRKTGVGKELLAQIESQAKEAGLVRWSTMVFDQHSPGVGSDILESQGYVPTERVYAKVLG